MSELCLTLLCPPEVEESLLDLLLLSANATVFTSTATAAHGLSHENLDQTEQVMGRARTTQVQVILAVADQSPLLLALRQQFAGTGVRYWLTPVIESGEIA